MKNFKDLSSLFSYLQSQINYSLQNEVCDEVKTVIKEHIQNDVYDVYDLSTYNRRGSNDGLIDDDNIVGELVGNGMLFVKDIAKPNQSVSGTLYNPSSDNTIFSRWINDGLVPNIFNNGDYVWNHERQFIDNAIEDIENNKKHIKVLANTLKKNGIKTK